MVGARPDLLLAAGAVLDSDWCGTSRPRRRRFLRNEQRLGVRVVNRAAEELAAHFNPERIALAITSTLHTPELTALQDSLVRARHRTSEVLQDLHLPHIPSREEFCARRRPSSQARAPSRRSWIARTKLLLAAVGTRLAASRPESAPRPKPNGGRARPPPDAANIAPAGGAQSARQSAPRE